jgi:hypothetical protein
MRHGCYYSSRHSRGQKQAINTRYMESAASTCRYDRCERQPLRLRAEYHAGSRISERANLPGLKLDGSIDHDSLQNEERFRSQKCGFPGESILETAMTPRAVTRC